MLKCQKITKFIQWANYNKMTCPQMSIFLGYILSLLITVLTIFHPSVAFPQKVQNSQQSVVEFDVPYELFAALSDYHDLTQSEEKSNLVIDEEIIQAIAEIIYYFEEERQKYLSIQDQHFSAKVEKNLEKMDAHLTDFRNELLFRKKVVEFRTLLEKQQKLKNQ